MAQDYPYEEMFRYLKTGLTGLTLRERDLLENYAYTWNIRGGTWARKKPWDMHPLGYGQTFTPEDTALVEELERIRWKVVTPLERLRKGEDTTGKGRALALYRFLEEIDLPARLEERANELDRAGNLNDAAQYRQLWDILVGGLEQCALLLAQTELELPEFSQLFSLVLSQYDVGAIPVSLDRVTVGETPRMAHKEVRYLFFLGADSATIPNCTPAAGLFSDQDREVLEQFDLILAPRQEEQLCRELAIAYETCTRPTEGLYVSYAQQVADGGTREPSFVIERLRTLFPTARQADAGDPLCRLCAPVPALDYVGRDRRVDKALGEVFPERVERLQQARDWRRGTLSSDGVYALYGRTISISPSRLDIHQSCHFRYFLQYGLRAKARKRAQFNPNDYGTFVHAVLEELVREVVRQGGAAAVEQNTANRDALIARIIRHQETEKLIQSGEESARQNWLFERMKESAQMVALDVLRELSLSEFSPDYLELKFGAGEDATLPPVEVKTGDVTLKLGGIVDRVDSTVRDGKRYIRVMDYKTGTKTLDYTELLDGRGLQTLCYLFALAKQGGALWGDEEEVVPAGALYVPARDPVISSDKAGKQDVTYTDDHRRVMRRKGLLLNDPEVLAAMEHRTGKEFQYLPINSKGQGDLATAEQLGILEAYVGKMLGEAATQMAHGNIKADPYWRGERDNACLYCEYQPACHFEQCLGDVLRRRVKLSEEEFWSKVAKEEKDGD